MREKIVCIDDDPALQEILRDYLEQKGFSVLPAVNGAEGLKLITAQAPDLVLLDWMLPDVTGIELCKHLRVSSSIPIIMLTGQAGEAERVLALEAGVDDYIVKPCSLLELTARIRSVLRRFHWSSVG